MVEDVNSHEEQVGADEGLPEQEQQGWQARSEQRPRGVKPSRPQQQPQGGTDWTKRTIEQQQQAKGAIDCSI